MEKKANHFSGQIGFVLAAAGSAVGVGNLWRFPYLAAKDGADKGRARAQELIEQAQDEARRIVDEARTAARNQQAMEREAQRQRTVELGTALASKLLNRELTAQDNSKLIDDFLNKVG